MLNFNNSERSHDHLFFVSQLKMLQNCKCLLFPPGLLSVALGNNSDSFRNVTVTTVESGKKMSAVFAISIATSLQNTNKNG